MGENADVAIPPSFVQELLSRTDVVEVVGRHVALKKTGANFSGLCPFHAEKSPSFTVSPTKQFYHCFGCGKSGDAIRFLMEHMGLPFVDAVKDLAQQQGLTVPEEHASPAERERSARAREARATLTQVLEKAAAAYQQQLKTSQRAVQYLKGRGLSGAVAKRFGLGYAPEGWRHLASVFARYDEPLLVESGLVIVRDADEEANPGAEARRYDRFRDRVMFPIRNIKGECIAFGGRVLGDEKPKYLNSPETPVFSKGRELYGLFEARQAIHQDGYALVTEGYMDVVALAQLGIGNAVATLGTACTPEHVRLLVKFTDEVVFSFDGDAAGRRAARKALEAALPHASDTRGFKFLFLPPEHDPDSFVRERGADEFRAAVRGAMPLSRFLQEAAAQGCDLQTPEGRARLAHQAQPLWRLLPDGALKRQLLADLAQAIGLDLRELSDLWARDAPPVRSDSDSASWSSREDKRPKGSPKKQVPALPGTPSGIQAPANSRSDHAVRLLLTHNPLWEELSNEDHALLAALPAPHGPLIAWIEGQIHEHGHQAWASLEAALTGHPSQALARRVMKVATAYGAAESAQTMAIDDARRELRDLVRRLTLADLERRESEAISAGDLRVFHDLHEKRKSLIQVATQRAA